MKNQLEILIRIYFQNHAKNPKKNYNKNQK